MALPAEYIGREQAYLKHTILRTYLERLFMIIGQSEIVINYVDCFAGPWSDENEELKDTSIGISIEIMRKSVATLKKNFQRSVSFRALYIEKHSKSFSRLQQFIEKKNDPAVTVKCLHGDYTKLIPDILKWSEAHFTFFFVDPKGWKGIIGASTMQPLLQREKTEFLINLMYDFANRAAGIEKHESDMIELLGEPLKFSGDETPSQRQHLLLNKYRKNTSKTYNGRSTYVPINRPGTHKLLYFLVYFSRHPKGIIIFKEVAEQMMFAQRTTYEETVIRKQLNSALCLDLFSDHDVDKENVIVEDNRYSAKKYLLTQLTKTPLLIDNECWGKVFGRK
jgi:three-Cys-motif partner protein